MKTFVLSLLVLFPQLVSTPAVVATPATKAKTTPHKKSVSRAATPALEIIQNQSAGRNGKQVGIDKSVHYQTAKHYQTINHNNYYRKIINIYPTKTVRSSDGAEFSFVIFPASPTFANDPLHIPFVLINNGRASVYNLRCATGFDDIEREGMSLKGGTFFTNSPARSVFGTNDHMKIQVVPDDVTLLSRGVGITIGAPPSSTPSPPVMTTADISFILTYSLRPGSRTLKSKYSFSLTNNGKGTWDWSRE